MLTRQNYFDSKRYICAVFSWKGGGMVLKQHRKPKMPACLQALGFTEMPGSEKQIKDWYRQLAREAHPDRGGNFTEFVKIRKAYENSVKFIKRKGGKLR